MGARLEIFKSFGATEYTLHDVNDDNVIIGRATISGQVRVPEHLVLDGFDDVLELGSVGSATVHTPKERGRRKRNSVTHMPYTPREKHFIPPAFGVTVLGNSHGFDKNGSVSGYVLWINGRGIMIDPPPFSTATLEREGIRSNMIVGIILTHCHADHDAGAFQKVLSGSKIVIVTTPTIYESFIRKYSALSEISEGFLKRSHRHRAAIIGAPLRLQGADFYFFYTLHTIPCIGFRVEWRGRSMAFTGDHLNDPKVLESLVSSKVMTRARASFLNNMPHQKTDLLLHEAGVPPIHTPLSVLEALPASVKSHLYVVHTSNLPPDTTLRMAPTGTAGTIRLDSQRGEHLPKRITEKHSPTLTSRVHVSEMRKSLHKNDSMYQNSPELLHIGDRSKSIAAFRRTSSASIANSSVAGGNITGSVVETPSPGNKSRSLSVGFISMNDKVGRGQFEATLPTEVSAPLPTEVSAPLVPLPPRQPLTPKSTPGLSLRPTSSTDAWFMLNLLSPIPFIQDLPFSSTMELLELARVQTFHDGAVVLKSSERKKFICVVWEGALVESAIPLSSASFSGTLDPVTLKYVRSSDKDNKTFSSKKDFAIWYAGDWTGPLTYQPDFETSSTPIECHHRNIVANSNHGVKVIKISVTEMDFVLQAGSPLYLSYRNVQSLLPLRIASGETNFADLIETNSALRRLTPIQKRHLEALSEERADYDPGEYLWKRGDEASYAFIVVKGSVHFGPKGRKNRQRSMSCERYERHLGEQRKSLVATGGASTFETNLSTIASMSSSDSADHAAGGMMERRATIATSSVAFTMSERRVSEEVDEEIMARMRQKRQFLMESDDLESRGEEGDVVARQYNRRVVNNMEVLSKGHFLANVAEMIVKEPTTCMERSPLNLNKSDIPNCTGTGRHSSTLRAGGNGCTVVRFKKAEFISFLDKHPGVLLSLLGTEIVV